MDNNASNADARGVRELAVREYRLLKAGVVAMLVLACAVPLALNLVDPDLWGHWQYGQDWIAEKSLPRTASHTYASPGHLWINHENAAELIFAVGFDQLGVYPMLALKCLLGLAILTAMVCVARKRGVHLFAAWGLMLLVANNLQAFFPMRPQLLSFALLAAALVSLDRAFPEWPKEKTFRVGWLWLLPVLFAVWVNSHGAFVAGLCIVGAVLLGRMIELLVRTRSIRWGQQLLLGSVGIACVAATVVNPYGLGMHRWLIESLGSPRPEITEWAPPTPDLPVFWPFVTLSVVAAVSLLATRCPRDWTQIAVLALVGIQAGMHLRHIAIFALLCGFWLPAHMQSALARLRPDRSSLKTAIPSWWLRTAMAAAIVAAICFQGFALAGRLTDFPVRRDKYPVDAVQFMVDHGLKGKLVVAFNWAQYAISALSPDVTVGFDGRFRTCYPQEIVDMHFDFLLGDNAGRRHRSDTSGPLDSAKVLRFKQPDLVLIDRGYKNAVDVMAEQGEEPNADWTLLYRDPIAELWGRSSQFDDPNESCYVPPEERRIDVALTENHPQWPALPIRRSDVSAELNHREPPATNIRSQSELSR